MTLIGLAYYIPSSFKGEREEANKLNKLNKPNIDIDTLNISNILDYSTYNKPLTYLIYVIT